MNHQHQLLQNMLTILNRDRDMNSENMNENNRNNNNNNNNENSSSFSTFFSGLLFSGLQSYLQQDRTPLVNHIGRAMQQYMTQPNMEHVMEMINNININGNRNNGNNGNNGNGSAHFHYEYNEYENDDAAYAYRFEEVYIYNNNNQENKESKENLNNEYSGKIVIPCELDEKEKERYSQYDSCSICFEAFNMNDPSLSIALTECKHAYHLQCINEWFKRKKDCPVCRNSL